MASSRPRRRAGGVLSPHTSNPSPVATTAASDLPVDIWTLVFSHLSLNDRMRSCSSVSSRFLQAANAVPVDDMQLHLSLPHKQQSFEAHMERNGSKFLSLALKLSTGVTLAQLRCPRLLQLEISGQGDSMHAILALGPRNGLPGVLGSCTGLLHLVMNGCMLVGGMARDLPRLSTLTRLTHLSLQGIGQGSASDFAAWKQGKRDLFPTIFPGSVLPELRDLRCLDLAGLSVVDLHMCSGLSRLTELALDMIYTPRFSPPLAIPSPTAPGFPLPTQLRKLALGTRLVFDPAVLPTLPLLTQLFLHEASVQRPDGGAVDGGSLLAAVSQLQHLRELVLIRVCVAWPAPSAAYSALTASSALRSIVLWDNELHAGVWEHVFPPAGPVLPPTLTRIQLCSPPLHLISMPSAFLSADVVAGLARRRMGLQDLVLQMWRGPAVAALRPLTTLTSLRLFVQHTQHTQHHTVPASAEDVAQLTNLRSLRFYLDTPHIVLGTAPRLLLPLAALQQLTKCELGWGFHQCEFSNTAVPGQPPNVWEQVRNWCLTAMFV